MGLNITLINPPILTYNSPFRLQPTPPLGLALIAGVLDQNGHQVNIIDCVAESPDKRVSFKGKIDKIGLLDEDIFAKIPSNTDLVGISCMFSDNWLHTRLLIDEIATKLPNCKVIVGGEHFTAAPEKCFNDSNKLFAGVFGEGEQTIENIAKCLESKSKFEDCDGIWFRNSLGQVVQNKRRIRIANPELDSMPGWHLFPIDKYKEHNISYGVGHSFSLPLLATRGCPYECTFCSSPNMWGRQYLMRSPEHVFKEIRYIHDVFGATNIDFYDLTAILKKSWIVKFCKILIESEIGITWQIPAGTRAEAIDDEVSKYLFDSGCTHITYAPESGSPKVLKEIKKRVNLDSMLQSIKHSSKNGLNIKLNMIIGFPTETHFDILKTTLFLIKCSWYGANDAFPGILSAYPGTVMFNEINKNGNLKFDDEFLINILESSSIYNSPTYSRHLSKFWVLFYFHLILILFYASNYLFRPWRFFTTIKNVATKNYNSRAEKTLGEFIYGH